MQISRVAGSTIVISYSRDKFYYMYCYLGDQPSMYCIAYCIYIALRLAVMHCIVGIVILHGNQKTNKTCKFGASLHPGIIIAIIIILTPLLNVISFIVIHIVVITKIFIIIVTPLQDNITFIIVHIDASEYSLKIQSVLLGMNIESCKSASLNIHPNILEYSS